MSIYTYYNGIEKTRLLFILEYKKKFCRKNKYFIEKVLKNDQVPRHTHNIDKFLSKIISWL